jgi:LysR family transcriptional regulator, regulator for metE and metH
MHYRHTNGPPMDLEIRHLKLVQAIAEEGSVTKAADRLHVTQSALSHGLRDAEDKLGTRLFLRLRRKMTLTPAGERLLVAAKVLLAELQRTEHEVKGVGGDGYGILKISTECFTCYHWLPSRFQIFQREFPHVELQVIVDATRDPTAFRLEGKLDVAVVNHARHDRRLVYRLLFRDEMVAVMKPDHPLRRRPFLRAQDFADQHLVTFSIPKESSLLFRRVLGPAGVTPARVSYVQLTEATVEMVKAGLGIAVLPRWVVAPQVHAGELSEVPVTPKGLFRDWHAVMLKGVVQPRFVTAFVELLARYPIPLGRNAAERQRIATAVTVPAGPNPAARVASR